MRILEDMAGLTFEPSICEKGNNNSNAGQTIESNIQLRRVNLGSEESLGGAQAPNIV